MNAVGIDVSKGKSTIAVLRPFGEIIISPFNVSHSPKELSKLVTLLKTLNGDTKVVMKYTGNYYLPIAQSLRNNGIFVSVVNPILVKDYSTKSLTIRKVKTDKKDALKIASFALDRWNELSPFSVQSEARLLLKSYNRQYNQYNKLKIILKNNLTSTSINETLASLASEMNKIAAALPEYDTVMYLFGVGSVLGSQLIAEIGNVSRFPNKKALVGFAGLDSFPFQSGNFNPQSRPISKRGSAALRKTLFQVMSVVLQRTPIDIPVFQFMDKKRTEDKHFYVYMTAAANKFLRITMLV